MAASAADAHPRYLLSQARILRTSHGVFSAIVLAPDQFFLSEDYIPGVRGQILAEGARSLGDEGGTFILRVYRNFYASIPSAMAHIEASVAPSIENGAILDGYSSTLLLFRDGDLVGTLKSSWGHPLPFQGSDERELETVTDPSRELRELKHFVLRSTNDIDGAGLLLRFATSLSVLGERVERRVLEHQLRTRAINSHAYYAHTELPIVARYYERRGNFRPSPALSATYGGFVLRAAPEELAVAAMPGVISAQSLWSEAPVEKIGPEAIHDAINVRRWNAPTLIAGIRSGAFRPVSYSERCADWMARGAPVPRRFSPGYGGSINP